MFKLCKLENNEAKMKRERQQLFIVNKQKIMWTCQENKLINKDILILKIHKKLKLNIDHHDKSCKNNKFFQV